LSSISVVIPTYNRADLLKLTLESVLAQTLRPTQVLVIDDGSTDNTAEVCASFPSPVQLIRQQNNGVAAARNRGMREATGDWIAFCDSDDLWVQDKLRIQMGVMLDTGSEWSITDFGIIDPEGTRRMSKGFQRAFPIFPETRISPEAHFGRWLEKREVDVGGDTIPVYTGDAYPMLFLGNVVIPSTSIVARELIERVGPFDEKLEVAEDTEYFHRVAALSPVSIIMAPLTDYRIGHPSLVSQRKTERLIGNALISGERAAKLRIPDSQKTRDAIDEGQRMLRVRLAYSRLADRDRNGVRQALRSGSGAYILTVRSTLLLLASYLPDAALRGIHSAKRALKRMRR
jgi:GT2 family glycosyltransferase